MLTSEIQGSYPEDPPVLRVGKGIALPINKSFSRVTVGIGVWRQIASILRKKNYDIIHIHGSLAPMLPMAVLHYSHGSKSTVVATFHAGHSPSVLYNIFKHYLYERYFRRYDGLIAVSPIAEQTMAHFFSGRYKIIPNGVDTEIFSPGPSLLLDRLPKSSLKLLFMGRFDAKKGLRHLLKALPAIKKAWPDVKLVVCGGGPLEKHYRRLLSSDIKDSVFFAGEVVGNIRREYYRWCDLSITPSIGAESFGITLIEAMGCAKPVVASDIPAFRYVMSEREGIFVKPGDAADIARGVLELAGRRSQWKQIGKCGRIKALSYSWDKIAAIVENYYEEIKIHQRNLSLSKVEKLL